MKREKIKTWLDQMLLEFNRKDYLSSDPLSIVHRYQDPADQEIVAFISALLAYGKVKSIIAGVERILEKLGPKPASFLKNAHEQKITQISEGLYYRFFTARDIETLLLSLSRSLKTSASLEIIFLNSWTGEMLTSISKFQAGLLSPIEKSRLKTPGIKFMFSDPLKGTSKRWHMFLRWMIRSDDVDLGLWKNISPAFLIQPLDTHLFQIGRALKLTSFKSLNLKAALQMTERFKEWEPEDPIKYDFALCRIGVLGLKDSKLKGLK